MHCRSNHVRNSSFRLPVSILSPACVAILTTSSKLIGSNRKIRLHTAASDRIAVVIVSASAGEGSTAGLSSSSSPASAEKPFLAARGTSSDDEEAEEEGDLVRFLRAAFFGETEAERGKREERESLESSPSVAESASCSSCAVRSPVVSAIAIASARMTDSSEESEDSELASRTKGHSFVLFLCPCHSFCPTGDPRPVLWMVVGSTSSALSLLH